ncbi:MAG: hypothetical protein JWR60_3053 [Polaromonas sp.]|nr:hypothetical protein [Polaromonas sp.]
MNKLEAIAQKVPMSLAMLQAARDLEKEAVHTERQLYLLLMDKVSIYKQSEGSISRSDLLLQWKAAMQKRIEIATYCTNLAKSALPLREQLPLFDHPLTAEVLIKYNMNASAVTERIKLIIQHLGCGGRANSAVSRINSSSSAMRW